MFYIVDNFGIIRGQTSDRHLIMPLKAALEFVFHRQMLVARKITDGDIILEM